jgi:hypothetical protein
MSAPPRHPFPRWVEPARIPLRRCRCRDGSAVTSSPSGAIPYPSRSCSKRFRCCGKNTRLRRRMSRGRCANDSAKAQARGSRSRRGRTSSIRPASCAGRTVKVRMATARVSPSRDAGCMGRRIAEPLLGVKPRRAMLPLAPRSVRFVRCAWFILACIPLTGYHTQANCCWHANLRWSGGR